MYDTPYKTVSQQLLLRTWINQCHGLWSSRL